MADGSPGDHKRLEAPSYNSSGSLVKDKSMTGKKYRVMRTHYPVFSRSGPVGRGVFVLIDNVKAA